MFLLAIKVRELSPQLFLKNLIVHMKATFSDQLFSYLFSNQSRYSRILAKRDYKNELKGERKGISFIAFLYLVYYLFMLFFGKKILIYWNSDFNSIPQVWIIIIGLVPITMFFSGYLIRMLYLNIDPNGAKVYRNISLFLGAFTLIVVPILIQINLLGLFAYLIFVEIFQIFYFKRKIDVLVDSNII